MARGRRSARRRRALRRRPRSPQSQFRRRAARAPSGTQARRRLARRPPRQPRGAGVRFADDDGEAPGARVFSAGRCPDGDDERREAARPRRGAGFDPHRCAGGHIHPEARRARLGSAGFAGRDPYRARGASACACDPRRDGPRAAAGRPAVVAPCFDIAVGSCYGAIRRSVPGGSSSNCKGGTAMTDRRLKVLSIVSAFMLVQFATSSFAQDSFYKGKNVRIIVGAAAGGGYDTYSRTIARHMGKHVPGNPTFVVDNMPGAGFLISANHIYKVATPDGLTIGHFIGGLFLQQFLGKPGVEFESVKFGFVGAPGQDNYVMGISKSLGITSAEQWLSSKTVMPRDFEMPI